MHVRACCSQLLNMTDHQMRTYLPRNWSTAQQQIKEIKREIKRLKEDNVKEILNAMKGNFMNLLKIKLNSLFM